MMFYYIAESCLNDGFFKTELTKRFESLDKAQDFLTGETERWSAEGLTVSLSEVNGELWGASATDADYAVKHNINIFATPVFMGGGSIGL